VAFIADPMCFPSSEIGKQNPPNYLISSPKVFD
jgi:hypothetical protein